MEVELKPLPFEDAIAFFTQKGLALSPDSWRDLWEAAHAKAFTVARVTAVDVLEDIRNAVGAAVEQGVSLESFKRDLIPLLQRKGWFSPSGTEAEVLLPDGTVRKRLTPWRLETIYRTNVQSSYGAGRYRQMMDVAEDRPWWRYDAVNDSRTRPSHSAMHGKVYDYRHPVWDKWFPPNGYNCRCTVRTMSDRQFRASRLEESTAGAPFAPDAGFAYNAGREPWKPDPSKYGPDARRILEEEA